MDSSNLPFFLIPPDPLIASSSTTTVFFSNYTLDVINWGFQMFESVVAIFLFFIVFKIVVDFFQKM